MSTDHIETAIEAVPRPTIALTTTQVAAIASFTVYGAVSATRDAVRKVNKIRENRAAKKAVEDHEPRRSEA
jgi:hypothetical protein